MAYLTCDLFVPNVPLCNGKGGEVVAEEQVKAMNAAVMIAKGNIVPRIPGNTGMSRKSLQTYVSAQSDMKSKEQALTGRVFSPLPHMLALESGAKWSGPWPPTEPLRLWAQRKFQVSEGEARSIAFLVARKLKRVGMVGRQFFRLGYVASKPAINAQWAQALLRIKLRLSR